MTTTTRAVRTGVTSAAACAGVLLALAGLAPLAAAQPCGPWETFVTPSPTGVTRVILRDIDVVAPDLVVAVGDYTAGGLIRPIAVRWDGASWELIDLPRGSEFSDSHAFVIESVSPGEIYIGGLREFSPPGGFWGVHNTVWRSTDGGRTWSILPTPVLGGGSGDLIDAIEIVAPDFIWFGGQGHPQPVAPLPALMFRYNGQSFQQFPIPLVNLDTGRNAGNRITDMTSLGPSEAWAVGTTTPSAQGAADHSQIHRWNGSQWVHTPGPTPGIWNQFHAVEAVASDDVWAAGEVWEPGVIRPFLLRWNGSAWREVDAPAIFLDIEAFGPDDIWAVGSGVWRWDGSSWTRVESFANIVGAAFGGLDGPAPCALWAAGREAPESNVFRGLVARVTGGRCAADLTGDGEATFHDVQLFVGLYNAGDARADLTGDGEFTFDDVLRFVGHYNAGC